MLFKKWAGFISVTPSQAKQDTLCNLFSNKIAKMFGLGRSSVCACYNMDSKQMSIAVTYVV